METETKKIVLSAENIIDAYQNEQVLWNPELNGSEEAKEQTWMRLRDSLGRTYGRTASSLEPRQNDAFSSFGLHSKKIA